MPQHRSAGFSLVELSIVLVILGLLVGGILGGQSLIRAAELRKVTTELEQWQIAVNSFRGKYNSLPGDFGKATRFWTAGENCGSATQSGVCDGNGNTSISPQESQQFWLHLAKAGLINGDFSGANLGRVAGQDYPASATGGGWNMFFSRDARATPSAHNCFAPVSAFVLAEFTSGGMSSSLNAQELWSIDSKMDDGLPSQGRVQSSGCTTDHYDPNAEYDMQATGCIAQFPSSYPITAYRNDTDRGDLGAWMNTAGIFMGFCQPAASV